MDFQVKAIGENKGAKRIWLQGKKLERSGFNSGVQYVAEVDDIGVTVRAVPVGHRAVVRGEKDGRTFPIIDLNSRILDVFDGLENVKVIYNFEEIRIVPVASEQRVKERLARLEQKLRDGEALSMCSLAHGIGVMDDAISSGMAAEGMATTLAFTNELRDELVEHSLHIGRHVTDKTITLSGSMTEFGFDPDTLRQLGQVDVMSLGISCKGASVAGRAKNKHAHPEAHPEAGHLVLAFISILSYVNPSIVVLENVESYANTASMCLIRNQLAEFGYELAEDVLSGKDVDAFEHRRRFVMVAVTKGMKFDFSSLPFPAVRADKRLAEILDDVPLDDPSWSRMDGLKAKEERDAEAGKGFAMQIFDGNSDHIKTLTAGLAKNRSTDPKIQHPENPDLLRIPTLAEHARAKQIPLAIIEKVIIEGVTSKTHGHEMLGQSVVYQKFVVVGRGLVACLKNWIAMLDEKAEAEEFCLMPC